MRSFGRSVAVAAAFVALLAARGAAQVPGAQAMYEDAVEREAQIRRELDGQAANARAAILLPRVRGAVTVYENIVRRYPRSGYSDNALWRAAVLSADAFWQFGDAGQRATALRLFDSLAAEYPFSPLVKQIAAQTGRIRAAAGADLGRSALTLLKTIRREVLPDALRVTLDLEREAAYQEERLEGPPRVFVDLHNTAAVDALKDALLAFPDDVVRQIRIGRQAGMRTRVVLDLEGAGRHSVYPLYNPYRLVIDIERAPRPSTSMIATNDPGATWAPTTEAPIAPTRHAIAPTGEVPIAPTRRAIAPTSKSAIAPSPPAPASTNTSGGFSLSRQLGLGISRIVIDPGHGGHDPGAKVQGLNEADLVLDVAFRLEKLLLRQPGVEVALTRRGNMYVPLEERTGIANRAGADLFLSIHANASANESARGVETYFLNFAPDPEAEAIAARENAGSGKTMHNLPDIVKAIAMNNKIDESRDFASIVQQSMTVRLKKVNRELKSLGVKQAPFMVLIGATMPSALTEISFLTNRQEAVLLRSQNYRQQIAEALLNGITQYQKTLKAARQTVAAQ